MPRPVTIFNPEHDLCLANGDANFVPPRSALRFATDCAEVMDLLYDGVDLPSARVVPWGWDAVLKHRLQKQGVDNSLLPTDEWLARLRRLQHRSSWLSLQPDCVGVRTVDDVEVILRKCRHIVLKAPWSGSGRGLRWVSETVSAQDRHWIVKTVREQQCVIVEPRRAVAIEFALLYNIADGALFFNGYSLFETTSGVYRFNRLCSDEKIEGRVSALTTELEKSRAAIERWLSDEACTFYHGPVGVDMMVDRSGGLHVGEFNFRHTMGMVAHAYLRHRPWCEGLRLGINYDVMSTPSYSLECDPSRVVLLIGGNEGDRHRLMRQAEALIAERIGVIEQKSSVYETEPWGFESDRKFLNQVFVVSTRLDPEAVLRTALAIEADLGRQRDHDPLSPRVDGESRVYHSRPMDIDLIFYNDYVVDTPLLQLPHPRMHLRRFVLEPLCEIMPEYVHPALRKTMSELIGEVKS